MIDPLLFVRYGFLIQIISSLIITISCFLIYLKTRELYELTSYKGIKYFRNTFLFFGITQVIRFFLDLIRPLGFLFVFERPEWYFMFEVALFISIYASSMALIYLLLSIFWKKIKNKLSENIYLLHVIALVIALISLVGETGRLLLIIFQICLFFMLIVISLIKYGETKHKDDLSSLYLLYLIIFALWIGAGILELLTYFSPLAGFLIYLLSLVIFLAVLFKVLKKLDK